MKEATKDYREGSDPLLSLRGRSLHSSIQVRKVLVAVLWQEYSIGVYRAVSNISFERPAFTVVWKP